MSTSISKTLRVASDASRSTVIGSISIASRSFHTTTLRSAPRETLTPTSTPFKTLTKEEAFDIVNLQKFEFDDTTTWGHMILEKKRKSLDLLRVVELGREELMKNRIPFQPPTSSQPLRFSHHLSLSSPSSLSSPFNPNKRILQVPISLLPLKDDQARRRIKALAGSRWTIDTDGLDWVSGEKVTANGREEEKDGFIKMSEESFPTGRMNRKWLSDVLDKLVKEANNPTSLESTSLPLDTRHLIAKQKKKRGFVGGKKRGNGLEGFPKEWL